MRVSVLGAGGKVGREVLAQIAASPDLALQGQLSGRDHVGLGALTASADVLIDFSAPITTMALLDALADADGVPIVVGTTGFTAEQAERLAAEGLRRPILIGANFTLGFEPFRRAAAALAQALPQAGLTVCETYNAAKKPLASGTTQGLVSDLAKLAEKREVATEIHRIGDVAGINTIRFDLGVAEIELTLTVASRAAYAAGALAAARWLMGQPKGAYTPADIT
jgi:4-hydroxy-tetrahydrodipicolinate reductase